MKQASVTLSSVTILATTNNAGSCGIPAVAAPATTLMISTQLPVLSELLSRATGSIGREGGALWKALAVNDDQQM
jgi:hypothetical protein